MHHEQALKFALSTQNKSEVAGGPATWLGEWKNQIGSSMNLAVSGSDLSGTYKSANSAIGVGDPVTGKIKGWVAGDLISFVVLWPGGSMTAWTGQLIDDDTAPRIETLWHLVTNVPDADEPAKLWESTLAGADEFRR